MSYYSKRSRNVRRNYVIIAIVSAIISALITYFITKPKEEENNAPTGQSGADKTKECSLCSVFKCNSEITAMENADKTDILEIANTLKDYTVCACSNCNEECLGVNSIQGITEQQCNLVS